MKKLIIFPGQGAQIVGMGADICQKFNYAAEMVNNANDILGYDIKNICFKGPSEILGRTEHAQAAIYLTSAIIFEVVKREIGWGEIGTVAGLSLGEYSALYAAGCISFEDGLKLVRTRGKLMQEAGNLNPGTMASILKLSDAEVIEICEKANGYVVPANFNCPGQVVISGEIDAVANAIEVAANYKCRAMPLNVSGAFHSNLMKNASADLAKAIDDVEFKNPECQFIANVSAEFVSDKEAIKQGLIKQLTKSVLWSQSMQNWIDKNHEYEIYEVGPGKVLAGLMRKIDKTKKVTSLNSIETLSEIGIS